MILLRLLTTGKSLVGLREVKNRYRVMSRGLPKFSAKQNPFRGQSAAPDLAATPADAEAQASPQPPQKRSWYRILAAKFGRERSEPVLPIPARAPDLPAAPPTQGGLSLDSVKVLRNDLSDSDFEVVTRRRKNAEPKPAAAAASPDSAWGRAGLRIFGAGKPS